MANIQTVLALISTILGIILVFLKIFEAWIKVSGPVKDFLSNRKVWLVIAALIILGIYLFVDRDREVRVAIRTTHNHYVTAMGVDQAWVLKAETEIIDDFEEFTVLCQENDRVALQTRHEKDGKNGVVSAMGTDRDWILIGETNVIDDYEEFIILDAETGIQQRCLEVVELLRDEDEVNVAFQTWHEKDDKNRLVTAMGGDWDWVLRAETNELRASEKFTLILLSVP